MGDLSEREILFNASTIRLNAAPFTMRDEPGQTSNIGATRSDTSRRNATSVNG